MTFWVTLNVSIIVDVFTLFSCIILWSLNEKGLWQKNKKSSIAKTQMLHNDEFIFTGTTMCESCVGFYLCEYCKRFYLQSILFMQFWIRIWSFLFKNCVGIIFVIISEHFLSEHFVYAGLNTNRVLFLVQISQKQESDRFRNTGPKNS